MKVNSKIFFEYCFRAVTVLFSCFLLCGIAFFWQEDAPETIFADKILAYLLTPVFLFLLYRLEEAASSIFVTRFRSRKDALLQQLFRLGVCSAIYSVVWLVSVNMAAALWHGGIILQNSGTWFIRYALFWMMIAQFCGLIEKVLPEKMGVLSYIIVYLLSAFELLILSRILPTGVGLIFAWFLVRNPFGLCTLLVWNILLTFGLLRLCEREDILG